MDFIDIQHLLVKNIRFETRNANSIWFYDVTDVSLSESVQDGTVPIYAIHFAHTAKNILIDHWEIKNFGTDLSETTPAQQAALALIYNQDADSFDGFSLTTTQAYNKYENRYNWDIILPKLAEYDLRDDHGAPWTAEALQSLVKSIRIKSFGIQFTGQEDLIQNVIISNGSFDMLPGMLNMNIINLDIKQDSAIIAYADRNELPAGSGIQIFNNSFRHWGHSAVSLSRYADIDIHDNVFLDQTGQPLRRKSMGIHIEFSKDFSIHDNVFTSVHRAVDILDFWRRGEVRDNTITTVRDEAILVRGRANDGDDSLVIAGNTIDNEGCTDAWQICLGIHVSANRSNSPGNITITGNLVENTEFGIGIAAGEQVSIQQNTIHHANYAIGISGGNTIDISQNTFSDITTENVFTDPAFTGLLGNQGDPP